MGSSVLLRAALIQAASIALLAVALALALPHSFFEDWGWLAGPVAWLACAALTTTVLGLPLGRTMLGAAVAGLLSGVGVLTGVHWLGVIIAIPVFAWWCARIAREREAEPAWTSG